MQRSVALSAIAVFLLASRCSLYGAELSGKEIYEQACASCHGDDGRGAAVGTAIAVPLPDFTDCSFATREGDGNWLYLVQYGGPELGLSPQMPAFGDVLTAEQRRLVLNYIRGFCTDSRWPRGELNFRRSLFTTKAFPEDEVILTQDYTQGRAGIHDWTTELSLEHRLGPRGEVELAVPLGIHDVHRGATTAGIGDVTLAYKHVLYADLLRRAIFSVGSDLVVPTGDRGRGLGTGTVSFEPALLGGKELGGVVIQTEVRGIAPVDENRASRGVRYDLALGYPLSPLRRAWVPAVEFEALQDVTANQHEVFVTPEIYAGFSRRGHLAAALGTQVPIEGNGRQFDYRIVAFVLWDYADGGLWW